MGMRKKRKKAFVLSLDALLATIIVVMVTSFAVYHFSNMPENIVYLYNFKEVNDALAVLDYEDLLNATQQQEILQQTNIMLPNYDFKFNITTTGLRYADRESVEFGDTNPEGIVITSKRFFVIKNSSRSIDRFGVVRLIAWREP